MQYYGFEMYEEYNMQTASGTAESDVSGVYMNMVTKSGGNRFGSDNNFYFMNDSMQGDERRRRPAPPPRPAARRQQTGAAGNPIDISYDWSSTLGGPIVRDTAWGFGALRRWRLDQFQIGAVNPDGSQAIDDNRIGNFMGKVTWQAAATIRTSFMFNRNIKNRFHRRDSPYLFVEDMATMLQDQPAQNYVAQDNQVVGQRGVFDARFGRMWGDVPEPLPGGGAHRHRRPRRGALHAHQRRRDRSRSTPTTATRATPTAATSSPTLGGTHDFKAGLQLSWERMAVRAHPQRRHPARAAGRRRPFQAQIANTPIDSDHGWRRGARSCRTAG